MKNPLGKYQEDNLSLSNHFVDLGFVLDRS